MGRCIIVSITQIAHAMVLQFNSVTKALVVLLTVPLGLIGAFVGLAATHSPLGFMALLGIFSLARMIGSHMILLSSFFSQTRSSSVLFPQTLFQTFLFPFPPL